jgi:hypothetical protein
METEPSTRLIIHAQPHPTLEVQRAGFPLDHRYVEQCWAPLIGPSSTLLLRRLPWLWREGTSVSVDVWELGRSLGLGSAIGRNNKISLTLQRLAHFGFAEPCAPGELDVYTEAPPLSERQLNRVPMWTRGLHEQLLHAHLGEHSHPSRCAPLGPPSPAVQHLQARLARLQHPTSDTPAVGAELAR